MKSPIDGSRAWRPTIPALGALFLVTFFPLFLGRNFLPFERYPQYAAALARSSHQPYEADGSFRRRTEAMPWAHEQDFASITLFWAQDLFTAASLREGRLPLWDPYTGCGAPTLDGGQYRPFNPFRLPFYAWPSSLAYSATLVLQLLFGAAGALLWLRRRGLSPPAVLIGTGIFSLNPWVLERLVLPDASAYAVLPWCLLALERARWKDRRSLSKASLAFVLMGHVGHPEAAVVLTAFALLGAWEARAGDGERRTAVWIPWLAAGAAAAAAMAVLWVPPLRLWSNGFFYKELPIYLDVPYTWKALFAPASDLFVPPAAAALVLAAFFAARAPWTWIAGAAAGLIVLMPLPGLGHGIGEGLQRWAGIHPFYFKPVLWASLAFLAAYGVEALAVKRWAARAAVFVGGGGGFVGLFVLFTIVPLPSEDQAAMPFWAVISIMAGLFGLGLLEIRRREAVPILGALLVLLALATPISLNQLDWNRVDFRTNEITRWIRGRDPHARIASPGAAFLPVPPNLGQIYGVRCVEQVSPLFPNRYFELYHQRGIPPTSILFLEPQTVAFREAGASMFLYPNEDADLGTGPRKGGPLYSVYDVPEATGRLYHADRTSPCDPGAPIGPQILGMEEGSPRVAVIEPMGAPLPSSWPENPAPGSSADFLEDSSHRVRIRSSSAGETLLVLKDSWYPGWKAFIGGGEAPIYRVNGCFRGVIVPPGDHVVDFRYRPRTVYLSGAVSTLVTLALLAFSLRRRGPGKRPPRSFPG